VSFTCPDGHTSESGDYCDTCGLPIGGPGAAVSTSAPPAAPVTAPPPAESPAAEPGSAAPPATTGPAQICPSCGEANPGGALFCEGCGFDFTTGQSAPAAPAPPIENPLSLSAPVPVTWVAEVWVDPDWYEQNAAEASDPCPSAGLPDVAPLVGNGPHLIGRPSASRNVVPQIDCTPDSGVSRRHAQLIVDGDRWFVEDLGSTNGTFVAAATGAIPDDPIPSGQRRELAEGDRVFVGTWTRVVVRRATPEEAHS
jgi:hypothetical protein